MPAQMLPASQDPIRPGAATAVSLTLDGEEFHGLAGQTIAGVLIASGRLAWRRTSAAGDPRGLFCGIGVCFDCIVTVNGERDVRACQRRVTDGDVIDSQHDELPEPRG
jgi:predicted molibdopterin-dependent oxidoreductase YjgC